MESSEGSEARSEHLSRRGAMTAATLGVSAVLLSAIGRAQARIASEQSPLADTPSAVHAASAVDHAASPTVAHAASADQQA